MERSTKSNESVTLGVARSRGDSGGDSGCRNTFNSWRAGVRRLACRGIQGSGHTGFRAEGYLLANGGFVREGPRV